MTEDNTLGSLKTPRMLLCMFFGLCLLRLIDSFKLHDFLFPWICMNPFIFVPTCIETNILSLRTIANNTRALHRGVQYPDVQISKSQYPLLAVPAAAKCQKRITTVKPMSQYPNFSELNILISYFQWVISNIQISN